MGKKSLKKELKQKMVECIRKGLLSYGTYLQKELENAQGDSKKMYKKYIEAELQRYERRLTKLDMKLIKLNRVKEDKK
ncbi:MAG: hypothetical protein H6579_05845 [Chitinophagales bacterium]|nr:hypothetical protein [Bacteroidota bacterium]MCB9256631.1 hypothetical protein [Chitinophagales bacterium]